MEDEMEKLLSGLRLTEGERSGVRLARKQRSMEEAEEKRCLVGRLLTKRHFNVDAMAKTLSMVWRPKGGMDHKQLEGTTLLFQFNDVDDLRRVIRDGPWSFDGHALLLKEYEGDKRQTDISFDNLPIWVRIYNLPLDCMTREDGEKLGAAFGRVLEVEADKEGKAWGRYLRIRVSLQVTDPLPRGVMLYMGDNEKEGVWCRAAYEKLPNFCYHCGKLDHVDKECVAPITPGQKTQYGAWLRASPGRKKSWGGGKRGESSAHLERSEGHKQGATGNLLYRFEQAGNSDGCREDSIQASSQRLKGKSPDPEDMSGGRSISKGSDAGSKMDTSSENREEITLTQGLMGRQSRVYQMLEQRSSSKGKEDTSVEVTSPKKKVVHRKKAQCPSTTKEKTVRRGYKAKPRRQGININSQNREILEDSGRKRKQGERGTGMEESMERNKRKKQGGGQLDEVVGSDDDMLLVDLVGAAEQPHQEQ